MTWGLSTQELIFGGVQLAAIVAFWARLEVTQRQQAKDIKVVKQALGFENGNTQPAFVRRETCELLHKTRQREHGEIRDHLTDIEQRLPKPGGRT